MQVGVDVHDQMASCVSTVELKDAMRTGEMKRQIEMLRRTYCRFSLHKM